jgi:FO synthase
MAHQYAPDKDPAARIRMHQEAGELRIPFTSGMLLGIGESAAERVETLLAIRALHDRYGHIQEAIIQPFQPKPATRMRAASSLRDQEVAAWAAMARLVLGREIQVQVPPNLTPGVLEQMLHAGVSDWGGVSPVTVDFVNPEAPWPALEELRERTAAAGQRLVERLPVHPEFLNRPGFLDPEVRAAALRLANRDGFAGSRQEAA